VRFNAPSERCVRSCTASIVLLALTACGGGAGDGVRIAGSDDPSSPDGATPSAGPSAPVASEAPEAPGSSSPPARPVSDGDDVAVPVTAAPDGGATGDTTDLRHGLSQRPPLSDFALSIEGTSTTGYSAVPVYPNLERIDQMVRAAPVPGEDRMLVVERPGRIKVFEDDPAVETTTTILDITSRVASSSSEQGLLGFAFDPAFESNRHVYIYYTHASDGRSIVTRLTWDAATDRLNEASDRQILEVAQPFEGHNGGMLEFGPDDGYLYVSIGDGGDGGDPLRHGQNRASLLGTVLRLDVHPSDPNLPYAIPSDNPFVGDSDARGEIYAYGLRNPHKFSFDRQTGELWLGDVGQNELEEIDLIVSGGNYGWPVFEGTRRSDDPNRLLSSPSPIPPVYEYGHDEGLAVIGGYVYRGDRDPSLFGRYLFADFAFGTVWALTREADGSVRRDKLTDVDKPTAFAETADGEVLVISYEGGLQRLEPVTTGPGLPPKLSETGLFTDLSTLTPISGLIGYTPSHPFWSDGVAKRRWLGVPDDAKIDFTADDWMFPIGTVSVKHFEIATIEDDPTSIRRLETRVLLHTKTGWEGYSYHWNAEQTDATLANGQRLETLSVALAGGGTREQLYEYPSRGACMVCHTPGAEFLLGPKTAQLNTGFAYPAGRANQIDTLNNIGLFDRDVGDATAYETFPPLDDDSSSLDARARAYLDVNCSSCHMPGGSAPTTMDFRASLPREAMNAVDVEPSAGDLGIANARIIASGDREASVLWHRIGSLDESRMPPISTHVVDRAAVELIGDWIDQLP